MTSLPRRWASLAMVCVWTAVLPSSARALPVGYDLQISVESESGQALGNTDLGALMGMGLIGQGSNPDTGAESAWLTGPADLGMGWSVTQWSSSIKVDPFLSNNLTVTNNTGGTAVFTFAVSSSIPAFDADEIIQSTLQLSLLDSDGTGGATLTSKPGVNVYQAFVNTNPALGLLTDPYSLSCSDPFDCAVLGNGEDAAGVASQAFGPITASEIGLTISFRLSDGDSAQVLSRFEVVPEPGTALLLALGLGVLAVRARRS